MMTYEEILNGGRQADEEGNTSPLQNPPFYITAYGLALRAGFRGTLEEWLESLIGPKGEPAELRYDRERDMVQWKLPSENEWKDLLALADLQRGVIAATLETLQAAANGAEQAQQAAERAKEAAATAKSEAEGAAGRAADSEANAGRSATSAENAKTDAEQAKAAAEEAAADARAAITLWPIISTKTGTWMIYDASRGEYVDTGESANGLKGEDGIAPHIGSNGHWYVGNTDTGVAAVGPAGENGVGIADVMVTSGFGDGATNEITLYLSDGRTATMGVKNGSKGSKGEKGNDGITPEFTLTQEKTEGGSVINVGIKTGDKSEYRFIEVKDGQTPYIGPNGNWWVGETDTGASADGAGTTVMYVNGDGYLYSTEDTSDPVNRVTLSQLRMLIERGGEVAVETRYKDTVYRSLGCTAGFTEVYGWLAASTVVEGIDAAVHMMYYTAEYVEPPPVELYAGEDRYLYRTEDISDPANRLTVEELRNIDVPRRDVVVWLCEGEEQIEEKPYRIEDYEEWGTIGVIKQGMLYWLYTAEYTGPMAAYSFAQENTDEWEVTEE